MSVSVCYSISAGRTAPSIRFLTSALYTPCSEKNKTFVFRYISHSFWTDFTKLSVNMSTDMSICPPVCPSVCYSGSCDNADSAPAAAAGGVACRRGQIAASR